MRREWIEMFLEKSIRQSEGVSLHAEGVDWNNPAYRCGQHPACLPPCGGSGLKWVVPVRHEITSRLPPCGGSGLKFSTSGNGLDYFTVSLHAEGVDWNYLILELFSVDAKVSLHAEGVDWNISVCKKYTIRCRLPPCGGSGLKFADKYVSLDQFSVSLHAEGVDWNRCNVP